VGTLAEEIDIRCDLDAEENLGGVKAGIAKRGDARTSPRSISIFLVHGSAMF
jgi:hypothetical protein